MSEWRPEGWRNLYGWVGIGDDPETEALAQVNMAPAYEAGADAILAALREQDIRNFGTLVGWVDGNPSGTLVYIPEAPGKADV
ncbi:hypothetical protein LCGC14_1419050 [marine sediment metagenome]|uniref:Uncharacterized protein n=1 Tax=marine sediment metagenome TaxID=412755 RepID=A0A0F9KD65_9ZZZZ